MHQHIFNAWFQSHWWTWAATTCSLHSKFHYSTISGENHNIKNNLVKKSSCKVYTNTQSLQRFHESASNKNNKNLERTGRNLDIQCPHHHLAQLVEYESPTIPWSLQLFQNRPIWKTCTYCLVMAFQIWYYDRGLHEYWGVRQISYSSALRSSQVLKMLRRNLLEGIWETEGSASLVIGDILDPSIQIFIITIPYWRNYSHLRLIVRQ